MTSSRRVRRVRLVSLLTLFTVITSLFLVATPRAAQATCSACTLWSNSTTPTMNGADSNAYELGVRFQSARAGYISGIRFYKFASNTSPHTASLWSLSDGKLLATAEFTNETTSGWQEASFVTPVAIVANVTYIASYHSNQGSYAQDVGYFSQGSFTSSPLTALDGVFSGGISAFPSSTWNDSNYWVDPVFTDSAATLEQTIQRASLFAEDAAPTSFLNGSFELGTRIRAKQDGYITALRFYKLPQSTGIHVGSLWNEDGTLLGRATFSNETESGWQEARLETSVPIVAHKGYVVSYHSDTGVVYEDDYFNATRFNGPLYGPVYTAGGNGLYGHMAGALPTNGVSRSFWADVVFASTALPATSEAEGTARSIWETSSFTPTILENTSPLEVGLRFQSARAGYIQGVRFFKGTTNTGEHLANLWSDSGQLLASATFSAETASGWQEVTFAQSVPISANTTYVASYHTNSGPVARTTGYFQSFGAANAPLKTTTGGGVYQFGASSFPNQTYDNSNFWVDVVFGDEAAGNAEVVDRATIWDDTAQPANPSNANNSLLRLGVKVRANRDGVIEGLHYFNADAAATLHTARLWNSAGMLLGSQTFTNEPTVGWQYIYFTTPVSVTANTTYVMSYDTTGAYPSTGSGLVTPAPSASPAIRALADGEDGGNGVYSYDTDFPTNSYGGSNYFVDVIFSAPGHSIEDPVERNMLWDELPTPAATFDEVQSVEVGLRFRSEEAGAISALRFYNSDPLTKTHIAHLWTNQGILLASQTIVIEANRIGWIEIPFTTPVSITANITYVASYWTDGPYRVSYTSGYSLCASIGETE